MGFCYARVGSRQVLCCDVCGNFPAKKINCPYGWCQATASCATCRPRVKALDHANCKQRHDQMEADKRELIEGKSTLTLYHCDGNPPYHRIREDGASFAACCIFNKTWVDQPEIDQLRAWGNTVVMDGERLAELVIALDEWISKGGFLPDQWRGK